MYPLNYSSFFNQNIFFYVSNSYSGSSGQHGGIGRNPSLPHRTKKRITTNLKSINNQKCKKIKLHGTPTTKELKKQSTRPTRPVRWADRDSGQGSGPRGQGWMNGKLRLRANCGPPQVLPWWEKLPISHESSLESRARAEQESYIFPSLTPPPWTAPQCRKKVCSTLVNT